MRRIRLVVVDDSAFVRMALQRLFEREPRIEVVGVAASGEEVLANLRLWRPDVVTLDLTMPGMGGLGALAGILEWRAIPVIILAAPSSDEASRALEALHRGAVDFIDKREHSLVDFTKLRKTLVERILQVVSHPGRRPSPSPSPDEPLAVGPYGVLVLGASTGGPVALQKVLAGLGGEFALPMVVVQHMPAGFTEAFAKRLDAELPFDVHEAEDGEALRSGTLVIAPAGRHLALERRGAEVCLELTDGPARGYHRPSIDILFDGAREVFGGRVIAVLMTGMGQDGTRGLLRLARVGAHTIVQDEATSVVFGMPRVAIGLGAARQVLPLEEIAPAILRVWRRGLSQG